MQSAKRLRQMCRRKVFFSFSTSNWQSLSCALAMRKCKLAAKIENRSLHFQKHPLSHAYTPRLSDAFLPPPMWKKFHRQQGAFDYAETKADARVFSVESSSDSKGGSRSFVVASFEEFWSYYRQLPSLQRHFYEVIPEGAPCHLYFDLEFDKTVHGDLDGEAMVDLWISLVAFCIDKHFNVKTVRSDVIELDSTTEKKFSQHLIWHIPDAIFENNAEAGKFVRTVCSSLKSYLQLQSNEPSRASEHWLHRSGVAEKLNLLSINNATGEKTLFVDEGVYTKNRNFRLYLSSKKGKTAQLELSPKCQFLVPAIDLRKSCCSVHSVKADEDVKLCRDKEKLVFFASVVTNVHLRDSTRVLKMPHEYRSTESKISAISVAKHFYSRDRSKADVVSLSDQNSLPKPLMTDLCDFVSKYVKQFNESAYIHKVALSRDSLTLFFDVSGTKYCSAIGREHKSNGIFIVVNLNNKLCFHRCYDYECRSKEKPKPFPLPREISESPQLSALLLSFADDVSDSELLAHVENHEKLN